MNDRPRVMIGIPGFHGIVPRAQKAVIEMVGWSMRHLPEYDFCMDIQMKREQFRARNLLISEAISEKCDYLLMLDDDMIPPKNLIALLLAHQKPVVGALYWQRGGAYHPVIMKGHMLKGDFRSFTFLSPDDPIIIEKPGLHEVDIIGGGCMLFETSVFQHLLKPYFWWESQFGTDISICFRMQEAGIPVHVDTSIEIPHWDEEGMMITRRTIPRHAVLVGKAKEDYYNDLKAYLSMTDEELLSAMSEAKGEAVRTKLWLDKPRDTWEAIRSYYQEGGLDHVLNLGYWNMADDPARNYVLSEIDRICRPGGAILDYGCGNGFLSVALADRGYTVYGYDIEDTPTMEFCQWREAQMGRYERLFFETFSSAVPTDALTEPGVLDGAIMISVIDHAFDPWGSLRWVTAQVKHGGFLVLDNYNTQAHKDEPQHLCRFDTATFVNDLAALGWQPQPESPYLFLKVG